MRPFLYDFLVRTMLQHIQSSVRHSEHLPKSLHGVLRFSRTAFGGAAIFFTLSMAESRVLMSLFTPTTTMTVCGPWMRQAVRFPVPSMLTRIPS